MNQPQQTRTVDTGAAITNTIVNRRPSCIHWITVSVEGLNAQGLIQIHDGSDAGGELVWQLEPGYSRHYNFTPPIQCQTGIFIYTDAAIGSYSIGYCPISEAPFGE